MVVNSTPDKGGTWNGAVENLKREWVPLWVRRNDDRASGNPLLVRKGARWLPERPLSLSSLWETPPVRGRMKEPSDPPRLRPKAETAPTEGMNAATVRAGETPVEKRREPGLTTEPGAGDRPSEFRGDFYSLFLQRLSELQHVGPLKDVDIAERLELEKPQVKAWLKRGVADGEIKKLHRPVRYVSVTRLPGIDHR